MGYLITSYYSCNIITAPVKSLYVAYTIFTCTYPYYYIIVQSLKKKTHIGIICRVID